MFRGFRHHRPWRGSTDGNPGGGTLSATGALSLAPSLSASGTALNLNITGTGSVTLAPSLAGLQGGATWRGNEPAGYTKITDHPFNTLTNSDQAEAFLWTDNLGMSIVTDSSAPQSPSNICREHYAAGFTGGSASGSIEYDHVQDMVASCDKFYLTYWYRLSSNFQGQSTGTNKMHFLWYDNVPGIFVSNEGTGSGTLTVTPRIQHGPDSRDNLPQNVGNTGDATCTRGVWHLLEHVCIMNTAGNANGIWKQWLDGKMTHNYSDVAYIGSSGGHLWQYIGLDPIWGGLGDTVTNAMDLDFDELYASGAV